MDYVVKNKRHFWGLYDGGTVDVWDVMFSSKNLYMIEVFRKHGCIESAYVTTPDSEDTYDRIRVENFRNAIKTIRLIEKGKLKTTRIVINGKFKDREVSLCS